MPKDKFVILFIFFFFFFLMWILSDVGGYIV